MRGAGAAVLPALRAAAERTGVDFGALYHTARLESGFNPQARARTSSATGLFQFVDSTWMSTIAKHGARHGIVPGSRAEALALRRDPAVASLMAAEHMADNAAALEAGGQEASATGLYLAHFLGAGGAVRFLKGMAAAPGAAAAELFPAAARANRSIFYAGSGARSLQEVYELFARKLGADEGGGAGFALAENGHAADRLPAAVAALMPPETGSALAEQPLHAARLAYLLLAEMGA
ncbi:transglycosylase SLT domain-containing protein [Sandaracinobacteroides hominis]|uniref:transglycosylase SLT domain-containing protein n=1 Tax=Sandaracinobacteroides hominis TaxID=2780086 RepID=UPI002E2CBF29|nr:transglycosylase SLT domain-containing protein [Sandaracinobacteroides hominis]